jgi:hypothetical protein
MTRLWDWPAAVGRRHVVAFAIVSAVLAVVVVYGLVNGPGYTDAYYYTNAANRMAAGQGMTDPYLWTYMGVPETLAGDWTVPSHQYWMPMGSLMAALSMTLLNAPGSYPAAQLPFALAAWPFALIGFALGARLGRTALSAWLAGLLTLLSPFYVFYWGAVDSVMPFALAGSACLLLLGLLVSASDATPRSAWLWAAAGALAALAHLSRPDGVLFLGIGGLFVLVVALRARAWRALLMLAPLTAAYSLVMLPWWLRNLQAIGAPLATGGAEGMFFITYDDLFLYPAGASLARFLDTLGWQGFLDTRWLALVGDGGISGNLGTFLAVEGMIFLAPLMVIGAVKRWRDPFLWPFFVAAIGIHIVMTLIFSFAGYRGALLHSAGALVPFWAALGVVGLRDVLEWVARRRRNWKPNAAMRVFGPALVVFAVLLIAVLQARHMDGPSDNERAAYAEADALLPAGARLFTIDPPEAWYVSGRGGAVIPQAPPERLLEVATRFDIRYLLAREGEVPGMMRGVFTAPTAFLREIPLQTPDWTLYEIVAETPAGS